MNRVIKFRGKRLDNGEWVYGYLYSKDELSWILTEVGFQTKPSDVHGPAEYDSDIGYIAVDPETVGQLTNLLDRNGKEIYDKDIVTDGYNNKYGTYVVSWDHEKAGWDFVSHDGRELEIIGNIYENPDLLTPNKEQE